jgi:hypothetical protein
MCRVNGVWACSCVRCCRLGVASGSAGQSWVIGLGALKSRNCIDREARGVFDGRSRRLQLGAPHSSFDTFTW